MELAIPTAVLSIFKSVPRSGRLTLASKRSQIIHFFWLLYGSFFLSIGVTSALGAEISDLIIDSSRDHLLVSVGIRDDITGETNAAPSASASATIIFSIALFEVKPFWFNKKIAHHTAINTIKPYPDGNEYRLLRSWHSGLPLKIDDLRNTSFFRIITSGRWSVATSINCQLSIFDLQFL